MASWMTIWPPTRVTRCADPPWWVSTSKDPCMGQGVTYPVTDPLLPFHASALGGRSGDVRLWVFPLICPKSRALFRRPWTVHGLSPYPTHLISHLTSSPSSLFSCSPLSSSLRPTLSNRSTNSPNTLTTTPVAAIPNPLHLLRALPFSSAKLGFYATRQSLSPTSVFTPHRFHSSHVVYASNSCPRARIRF